MYADDLDQLGVKLSLIEMERCLIEVSGLRLAILSLKIASHRYKSLWLLAAARLPTSRSCRATASISREGKSHPGRMHRLSEDSTH